MLQAIQKEGQAITTTSLPPITTTTPSSTPVTPRWESLSGSSEEDQPSQPPCSKPSKRRFPKRSQASNSGTRLSPPTNPIANTPGTMPFSCSETELLLGF